LKLDIFLFFLPDQFYANLTAYMDFDLSFSYKACFIHPPDFNQTPFQPGEHDPISAVNRIDVSGIIKIILMEHIGAKMTPHGVSFRIWAPRAERVDVVKDLVNWRTTGFPMQRDPRGYWTINLPDFSPGDPYGYKIHKSNGKTQFRINPATRDTFNSSLINTENYGIITDTSYPWHPFKTPAFDDLILYQCHLASFCGRNDGLNRPNRSATFNDAVHKLDYIRDLGFNAIALLPVQEFWLDRSWGYNPSFYFSIESAYGAPGELRRFVDECHVRGIAVIFDVVYNHISNRDSSFWHFDDEEASSYLTYGNTPWGLSPAFWEQGIKDFFFANMAMYYDEYGADGLRFDATRAITELDTLNHDDKGFRFLQYLTWMSKQHYPDKYLIAEHIPAHDTIVDQAGFHATWYDRPYYRLMQALQGNDTVNNIKSLLGTSDGFGANYRYSWNLIKYLLGSHDHIGDDENGSTNKRYYTEKYGGRNNWFARAKTRLAWALNIAIKGTPMLYMGSECHMPGYWHTEQDTNGDHRFDWSIAGDDVGLEMRKMVAAANKVRWEHSALRNGHLEVTHEDFHNSVLAFKRWNNTGDMVLVVVHAGDQNFEDRQYGVYAGQPGQWQQVFCSQDAEFGGWDGAGNAFFQPWTQTDGNIRMNLPKWSVLMLMRIG
jgi:1,4-alpha-glucan branching enzyme